MSFMDVLMCVDKAIDKGIKFADQKTAFIDKAEVFVCRGKTADERCDQGVAITTTFIKKDIKPTIVQATTAVKSKVTNLAGKAKDKIMPLLSKIPNIKLPKISLPKIKAKEPKVLDIPIIIEEKDFVPMARILDMSHKTPIMDLRSNKQVEVPVLAQMNVFVQNAMENTPFAEMR